MGVEVSWGHKLPLFKSLSTKMFNAKVFFTFRSKAVATPQPNRIKIERPKEPPAPDAGFVPLHLGGCLGASKVTVTGDATGVNAFEAVRGGVHIMICF